MRLFSLLFSIGFALTAGVGGARADSHAIAPGLYVELGAGAVELMDSDIEGGSIDTEADFGIGWGARAALGHGYDSGWRAEVEIGYRRNDVDSIGSSSGAGEATALSGMVNGYYDFDTGGALTPYVGLGAGVARIEADGYSPVSGSSIDDDDVVFAYQGIAGVAWSLSPSLALTADYRYFATDDPSLTTAGGTGVDAEYRSHSVFLGLRLAFGGGTGDASAMAAGGQAMGQGSGDGMESGTSSAAAEIATQSETAMTSEPETAIVAETVAEPEMAAADPLPDYARAYRVLFGLDSYALSGAAQATLREIVGHVLEGDIVRIEATGHADTSGTAAHNMTLSRNRAEAVMATLVDMGVPRDLIVVYWKGETDLLVETPDGTPEAQNRRVEIVFPE